jgi:hypothetical protein
LLFSQRGRSKRETWKRNRRENVFSPDSGVLIFFTCTEFEYQNHAAKGLSLRWISVAFGTISNYTPDAWIYAVRIYDTTHTLYYRFTMENRYVRTVLYSTGISVD